jgi:hypothetical protein
LTPIDQDEQSISGKQRPRIDRLELVIWAVCSCLALGVIFAAPGAVPVAPTVSDSYLFGYNNRVGVALLLFVLGMGGYFSSRVGVRFSQARLEKAVPSRAVWLWMAIYAVGCGVLYCWLRGFNGLGESTYFVDRLSVFLAGARPYRDFEFGYGVGFLYGPLAFFRLGLSMEQSYYLFLTLNYMISVWIIAELLNLVDYHASAKPVLFHSLCLFGLTDLIGLGMQYTFLRFLLAPYFALLVQRAYARHKILSACMVIIFTVVLLAISPEQAVMYAMGILGYLVVLGLIHKSTLSRDQLLSFVGLLIAESCALVWGRHMGLFMTMKTFSTGAFNFPILPAGHILLFLFCCGVVAMYVATQLRARSRGDGLLLIVAVSMCGLFATLGRCDPGHVVFDGIGIIIVATLLVSNIRPIWRPYQGLFVIFFLFLPAVSMLILYRPLLKRALLVRALVSKSEQSSGPFDRLIVRLMSSRLERPWEPQLATAASAVKAPVLNLQAAYPGSSSVLNAPFNFSPNGFGTYHAPRIDTGYFAGLELALTPESIRRKISELDEHPNEDLLLPDHFEDRCALNPAGEQAAIRILFWYPFSQRPKNWVNTREPLCTYISAHYRMVQAPSLQGYGYGLWRRI